MIEEIITCSLARVPVLWIVTSETARVEKELVNYALHRKKSGEVWIWSLTRAEGLPGWGFPSGIESSKDSVIPIETKNQANPDLAIYNFVNYAKNCDYPVFGVIRDPHRFVNTRPGFAQALRDATRELHGVMYGNIVCISPQQDLPEELKSDIEIVRPGLPDEKTLERVIKDSLIDLGQEDNSLIHPLVNACKGLTTLQTVNAIAKSLIKKKKVDTEFIANTKTKTISSVPAINYDPNPPSMEEVGGLDVIKDWVEERKEGFSIEAQKYGLSKPKGFLTVGIPGTGKSLSARALASALGVPLLTLDLGALKNSKLGASEERTRNALDIVHSQGNVVLRIDEIEKGMPSSRGKDLDAGVGSAILGTILTWMSEVNSGAVLAASANDISSLPPELLRSGRFDEIFFVDLPNSIERTAICNIHLKKRGWKLEDKEIKRLIQKTDGFSGAEIEGVVEKGLWKAFSKKKPKPEIEDFLLAAEETIPLSVTKADYVKALREWAKHHAKLASYPEKQSLKTKEAKVSRRINLEDLED